MTNTIHRDPNVSPIAVDSQTSSISRRFLSATAEYAAFCAGAIVLVLFCMAFYALVHRSGAVNTELRDWLLPLSLVINVLAALSVGFTVYLLKRLSRLEAELIRRNSSNSWPGMLPQ